MILSLVIIAIIALMIIAAKSTEGTSTLTPSMLETLKTEGQLKGSKDAKVVLIEFSDLECPACRAYSSIVKKIREEDTSKGLAFVYVHFPLPQHTHAFEAAYAAEAAGMQGKFWEMHDLLFENQLTWAATNDVKPLFLTYARKLGLNEEKFNTDVQSQAVQDKVDKNYQEGIGIGIDSTPTFFLNGVKLVNPQSEAEFQNLINQALNAKS